MLFVVSLGRAGRRAYDGVRGRDRFLVHTVLYNRGRKRESRRGGCGYAGFFFNVFEAVQYARNAGFAAVQCDSYGFGGRRAYFRDGRHRARG